MAGRSTRRKVCQRDAPSTAAASSRSGSSSSSTGCTVRITNGRPMKVRAIVTPSGVNATSIPARSSHSTDPAGPGVDRGEGDAAHRRRQREGQVHDRVDERAPGEAVAGEHPRHEHAEHDVERGGDQRRAEAEAVRGERAGRRDDPPGVAPQPSVLDLNASVESGTSTTRHRYRTVKPVESPKPGRTPRAARGRTLTTPDLGAGPAEQPPLPQVLEDLPAPTPRRSPRRCARPRRVAAAARTDPTTPVKRAISPASALR